MKFAVIETLFLKQWDGIITTVPVRKLGRPKLMPKLRRERRSSKLRCIRITYNRNDTKLLRCGSVSGGVFIKPMHQSKVISGKTFSTNSTNVLCVKSVSRKDLSMGDSLVRFNVILMFLKTCLAFFQTFCRFSKNRSQ